MAMHHLVQDEFQVCRIFYVPEEVVVAHFVAILTLYFFNRLFVSFYDVNFVNFSDDVI